MNQVWGSEVIHFSKIIDCSKKEVDVLEDLKFVKIPCGSIEEAKRRATIMALHTFDFRRKIFLMLATPSMMEKAFFTVHLKRMKEAFGLLLQVRTSTKLSILN
jgi:hypothetical protein